ncbi:MAG: helix-turn-helix transcriptional regulator [Bacteroidaceae bacterium]|nr:helix-turn-helix transcriptional regulator [Bacteroidaceae bacterium]
MTVREVFDLRKQGLIEEAYEAIRPMYAVHKGKYTTLCMFWTARDIFNKRIFENRIEEAEKIYKALQRVLPNIDDTDGHAAAFMQYAEKRLKETSTINSKFPSLNWSDCLNKGQKAVLTAIQQKPGLRVPKLFELTDIPAKSIERHIKVLIESNLIEHRGSKKTGGYYAK